MKIVNSQNPIGSIIKIKRKIKGLTMQQFADMIGLTKDALNRIEANDRITQFTNIVKIVNTLGYDVIIKKQK